MWQDKETKTKAEQIATKQLEKYLRIHGIVKDAKSKAEAIKLLTKDVESWLEE